MSHPLFSVILSRHSQADHLQEAVESVRAQTVFDYELIIHESRNQSLQEAQGEFVAFLDSDDSWSPRKLEAQLALFTADPGLNWCYCHALPNVVAGESGFVLRSLLLDNFIPSSSVVVRRPAVEALGGFQERGHHRSTEDWDLWLRLAARHPARFVAEPLVHQRSNDLNASDIERVYRSGMSVVETMLAEHQAQLPFDLRSRALAQICVSAGDSYLKVQQRSEARYKYAEALTHNPLRSDAYLKWISSYLSTEAQQQVKDLQALAGFTSSGERQRAQTLGRR